MKIVYPPQTKFAGATISTKLYIGFYNILTTGRSHPFLGMGRRPMELITLAAFGLKLGKSILSICMKFPLPD